MSQVEKSSSELPTHSSYVCYSCGEDIAGQVWQVQRRRVRPLREMLSLGKIKHNPPDLVDPNHAGIIVGPEYDDHCNSCHKSLPTVQELIDAHKSSISKPS